MANETASYTDSNALLLLGLTDPPKPSQVRDDVVRQALARLAHKRSYDRLARVLARSDYDTLRSLLLVLTHRGGIESSLGTGYESSLGTGYECQMKEVASIPRDETFERICELASDVLTWEAGWSKDDEVDRVQVEIEFDRYVRPAWLAFTDEVEFELEGLDRDDQDDPDTYWVYGRTHSREELLEMGEGDRDQKRSERDQKKPSQS